MNTINIKPQSPRSLVARTVLVLGATGMLTLAGCGSAGTGEADGESTSSATATQQTESQEGEAQEVLTVEDQWLKSADSGMTAAFGTLTNDGDTAVTLTGAEAQEIAGSTELHETVMDEATGSTVMQEMTEPMVIEPGQSVTLEPGADHIMLMDLTCAPMAGQTLSVDLTFEDGQSQTVDFPVRDYQGAQEEYSHEEEGEEATSEATGMDDMGEMEGMEHTEDAELSMCEESS